MRSSDLIEEERAVGHLLDLLSVEGLSGRERRVADLVRRKLREAGCKATWIRHDDAHRRIGRDFEVGNLIVRVPGRGRGARLPRRLFSSHLDTVPLCRGAVPVVRGRRIVPRGKTALGADNRTAAACLVTVIETLLRRELERPPLTFLFTVGEEAGLLGSRHVRKPDLGKPRMGFNFDSGDPAKVIRGAVGAERWSAEVIGRSAHAGVHPEDGVSAILIASRALADVARRGYFGRVSKKGNQGSSNAGAIHGGEVTNQVPDAVEVEGESRSHDPAFRREITAAFRDSFERAARSVCNRKGRSGKVRFRSSTDYEAFQIGEDAPVVELCLERARALGLDPYLEISAGGQDANCLNAKGVPTVTLGAGQHNAHTLQEYADIREYVLGCRLGLSLATARP